MCTTCGFPGDAFLSTSPGHLTLFATSSPFVPLMISPNTRVLVQLSKATLVCPVYDIFRNAWMSNASRIVPSRSRLCPRTEREHWGFALFPSFLDSIDVERIIRISSPRLHSLLFSYLVFSPFYTLFSLTVSFPSVSPPPLSHNAVLSSVSRPVACKVIYIVATIPSKIVTTFETCVRSVCFTV